MSNKNENLFEQLLAIEEACREAQRQLQVNNGTVNDADKFTSITSVTQRRKAKNSYSLFKTLQ